MSRCCLPVLAALSFCLLSGCGPTKGQVETEVKKGLEEKMGKKVSSLSLTETGKGNYEGTATLDGGDTFELLVKVEGNTIRWKALPDKAGAEKEFRHLIESKTPGIKVLSVTDLSRDAEGNYTGKARLSNGTTVNLKGHWEGDTYMLEAKPE
jgi:hypothetical protein